MNTNRKCNEKCKALYRITFVCSWLYMINLCSTSFATHHILSICNKRANKKKSLNTLQFIQLSRQLHILSSLSVRLPINTNCSALHNSYLPNQLFCKTEKKSKTKKKLRKYSLVDLATPITVLQSLFFRLLLFLFTFLHLLRLLSKMLIFQKLARNTIYIC